MDKQTIKHQLNQALSKISDSIDKTSDNIWFTKNGRMIIFGFKFYNNSALTFDSILEKSDNEYYVEYITEYRDKISTIIKDNIPQSFLNSIVNTYYRNKNSVVKTKFLWNSKSLTSYINSANELYNLECIVRDQSNVYQYVSKLKPLIKTIGIYRLSPEYDKHNKLTHIELESKFMTLDILYEFDYLNFKMGCHAAIYSKLHNKRRELIKFYMPDNIECYRILKQSTIDIAKAAISHFHGLLKI